MKNSIDKLNDYYWITTYDKSPHIADVYNDTEQKFEYNLNYSANKRKIATEYLFASKKNKIESFDKVNLLRI
ncbi:hypothetical protein AF113_14240 [Listeria monocytogenes]|nr:hypothetical protein [Listeria monocytogenes]